MHVEDSMQMRTRHSLYGGRTLAMRFHYRVKVCVETIQYVEVMRVYHWAWKYFKFPVGHPTIHPQCDDITRRVRKRTGAVHSAAYSRPVSLLDSRQIA